MMTGQFAHRSSRAPTAQLLVRQKRAGSMRECSNNYERFYGHDKKWRVPQDNHCMPRPGRCRRIPSLLVVVTKSSDVQRTSASLRCVLTPGPEGTEQRIHTIGKNKRERNDVELFVKLAGPPPIRAHRSHTTTPLLGQTRLAPYSGAQRLPSCSKMASFASIFPYRQVGTT